MTDTTQAAVLAKLRGITQDHARTGAPLDLNLSIPGMGEVICLTVFRAIRGKRLVCLGNIRGTKVVVKLYFAHRRAHRHWRRSENGCRAFLKQGIPAPGILFSGYLPAYGLYVMVLDYLEGGMRIDWALEKVNDEQLRIELIEGLVQELARQHLAGILQNDLHLGNFIVKDHLIYSLDGDQVKHYNKPLRKRKSLVNLSHLLANLPSWLVVDYDKLIRTYLLERKWIISDFGKTCICHKIDRITKKNLSSYLRKTLRSKDPFIAQSALGLFTVFDRRYTDIGPHHLLDNTGKTLKPEGALGRIGYCVRAYGDKEFLLYSSYDYGLSIFKPFFKAVRVWKNALMLNKIGLKTPLPVGLILKKKGSFLWHCSVYFNPIKGIDFMDFYLSPRVAQDIKKDIVEKLIEAIARLRRLGISIGPLELGQIMVLNTELVFLDPGVFYKPLVCAQYRIAESFRRFLFRCSEINELIHSISLSQI